MKKFMMMAALLGFAVACGGEKKAEDKKADEATAAPEVVVVEETVAEETVAEEVKSTQEIKLVTPDADMLKDLTIDIPANKVKNTKEATNDAKPIMPDSKALEGAPRTDTNLSLTVKENTNLKLDNAGSVTVAK